MDPSRLRLLTNRWPFDRGVQRAMRLVSAIQHRRDEPNQYEVIDEPGASLRMAVNLHHRVQWTMFYFARPLLRATRASGAYRLIVRMLQPQEPFIDIGANFGLFTLQIARLNPDRPIIAVEPCPAIAESLARSAEANRFPRIAIVRAALGSQAGERDLFIDERNFGGHALHRRPQSRPTPIRVPVMPFDEAIAQAGLPRDGARLGAVKIDVEGAEANVVAGMRPLLERGERPPIICEVRGPKPTRDGQPETPYERTTAGRVDAILREYGYCPHTIDAEGTARLVESDRIRGLIDLAYLAV